MASHYDVTITLNCSLTEENISKIIFNMLNENYMLKKAVNFYESFNENVSKCFAKEIINRINNKNYNFLNFYFLNSKYTITFKENIENLKFTIFCSIDKRKDYIGYDDTYMDFEFHIKLCLLLCKNFSIKNIETYHSY